MMISLTFSFHSNFLSFSVPTIQFRTFSPTIRRLSSTHVVSFSVSSYAQHHTFVPSFAMADPDVGASDAERQITEQLRLYNASMTEFIRTELTTTTRDATRSENLKRFSRFHPMEDDPLREQKMPLYKAQLHVGIVNSKHSDTDSRSGEPPFDDASESEESWSSTSDPGEEELAGPTASLPGFVGGTAGGLATQPDATTKTAGDQVLSLPPLQIDATSLVDKNMMNLFGDDEKFSRTMTKARQR